MKFTSIKPGLALILYSLLLLLITVLAYNKILPTTLSFIPNYDSIGHFVLFGTLGYLFAKAFERTVISFKYFYIPAGIVAAIPIVVIEESLQALSSARTFSFFDMGWGIAGIVVACLHINRTNRAKNQAGKC